MYGQMSQCPNDHDRISILLPHSTSTVTSKYIRETSFLAYIAIHTHRLNGKALPRVAVPTRSSGQLSFLLCPTMINREPPEHPDSFLISQRYQTSYPPLRGTITLILQRITAKHTMCTLILSSRIIHGKIGARSPQSIICIILAHIKRMLQTRPAPPCLMFWLSHFHTQDSFDHFFTSIESPDAPSGDSSSGPVDSWACLDSCAISRALILSSLKLSVPCLLRTEAHTHSLELAIRNVDCYTPSSRERCRIAPSSSCSTT
jgi:hypothetical protein